MTNHITSGVISRRLILMTNVTNAAVVGFLKPCSCSITLSPCLRFNLRQQFLLNQCVQCLYSKRHCVLVFSLWVVVFVFLWVVRHMLVFINSLENHWTIIWKCPMYHTLYRSDEGFIIDQNIFMTNIFIF